MDKESIKRMQELAFELEGLIGLAIDRPDMEERLPELVRNKLNSIEALLPAEAAIQPEEEYADEELLEEEIPEEEIPEEGLPEEVIPGEEIAEDDISEEELPEDEISEEVIPGEEIAEEELPDAEIHDAAVSEEITSETASEATPTVGERRAPVFSINDRFRFIRELFDGNKDAFDSALTQIAACEDYDEAEEYVISELDLDPELPSVQDFLLLISRYF